MNYKAILKRVLPTTISKMLVNFEDYIKLQCYIRGKKIPWSFGYLSYRKNFIKNVLSNEVLMQSFHAGNGLPGGYGIGIDERCIEYPWTLAHLSDMRGSLLDAGSTLNFDFILAHSALKQKIVHIMTLSQEENSFQRKGVSYFFNDLRNIPMNNGCYDAIICLSTLEHIGCDNTLYTGEELHYEARLDDFTAAMKEISRVLKKDGSLFLTVPFGIYKNFGTFQQFDRKLLTRAVEAFGKASYMREFFYRYTKDGWRLSNAEGCAGEKYVEWVALPPNRWPKPIPREADLASAARAVACVHLVK